MGCRPEEPGPEDRSGRRIEGVEGPIASTHVYHGPHFAINLGIDHRCRTGDTKLWRAAVRIVGGLTPKTWSTRLWPGSMD